jgi:glycosyltransferase involved in cell wall biosynthesis
MSSNGGRVWVVTECYPRPEWLSRCAFVHRQLVGLQRCGWEVRVLVPNGWRPAVLWRLAEPWRKAHARRLPAGWSLDGIAVGELIYSNRYPRRWNRPSDTGSRVAAALTRQLERAGARAGRDLLLAQFALPHGPAVRRAARAAGLRYAVHLRGDDVWQPPAPDGCRALASFREALADASLVLAVAQALLDQAARLVGRPLPASARLANGIELERFRPPRDQAEIRAARARLGLEPDALVVLCVAACVARKGWGDLLQAIDLLPAAVGDKLVLLAATGSRPPELDLASLMGPAARARLMVLPSLGGDRLAELYRAADVFCLASHWEGLSNALLEAMASGLPVVATAVAGHPEVIQSGREGLLVPPRNPAALSAALSELLAAPERRRLLGRAARQRAEQIGTPMEAGGRLAELLDGVRADAPIRAVVDLAAPG